MAVRRVRHGQPLQFQGNENCDACWIEDVTRQQPERFAHRCPRCGEPAAGRDRLQPERDALMGNGPAGVTTHSEGKIRLTCTGSRQNGNWTVSDCGHDVDAGRTITLQASSRRIARGSQTTPIVHAGGQRCVCAAAVQRTESDQAQALSAPDVRRSIDRRRLR